jgi:hypothetical protein
LDCARLAAAFSVSKLACGCVSRPREKTLKSPTADSQALPLVDRVVLILFYQSASQPASWPQPQNSDKLRANTWDDNVLNWK